MKTANLTAEDLSDLKHAVFGLYEHVSDAGEKERLRAVADSLGVRKPGDNTFTNARMTLLFGALSRHIRKFGPGEEATVRRLQALLDRLREAE